MKLKTTLVAFLLVTLSVTSINAQDITNNKFGKGLINYVAKDSSFSVKFATRFQLLAITDWAINDGDFSKPESNFLVRRSRLKFGGFVLNPKIKYKIELGLTNRDISGGSDFTRNTPRVILDAVIKWNFYKNFTLWAGQTKLPGNVERVVSSANLQFVDRSRLNSRFNIDRDIGVQLRHKFNLTDTFIVKEAFAVSQGEGRNITEGNIGGHQYTGRVELYPFGEFKSNGAYKGSDLKREKTPKLMLAATYDLNDDASRDRSNQGSLIDPNLTADNFEDAQLTTDIQTIFVDAVFKYNGISFMGEFAHRSAATPDVAVSAGGRPVSEGNAVNAQVGYLFDSNWEVAGRYTNLNFNAGVGGLEEQITLGVSRYIHGHKLKVQSDLTYIQEDGSASGMQYRLQFDIHF